MMLLFHVAGFSGDYRGYREGSESLITRLFSGSTSALLSQAG